MAAKSEIVRQGNLDGARFSGIDYYGSPLIRQQDIGLSARRAPVSAYFVTRRNHFAEPCSILGDPTTVGGVANVHGLSVFDFVYRVVRDQPMAAR